MALCIYCQTHQATTRDHIPMKKLFADPFPDNLITVPACRDCNEEFGRDDEYFLKIALEWGASQSVDGRAVADKRLRALQRKEAKRYAKAFYRSLSPVEVITPSGLFVANSFEFKLDRTRLLKTINRMIRALFFYSTGSPLAISTPVNSLPYNEFVNSVPANVLDEYKAAMGTLRVRRFRDAFAYRYVLVPEQPETSLWNLRFYDRIEFIGLTGDYHELELTPTDES